MKAVRIEFTDEQYQVAQVKKGDRTWRAMLLGEKDRPEQVSKAVKDYIEDFVGMKLESFERRLKQ